MANPQVSSSADGTRPVTSGGVDNIGAGKKLASSNSAAGDPDIAPAGAEGMQDRRQDVAATRGNDSAPFGLRENLAATPNVQPGPPPTAPGDDAPAGTPGTGEKSCPQCGGSGRLNGQTCASCQGTGKVTAGVGGG